LVKDGKNVKELAGGGGGEHGEGTKIMKSERPLLCVLRKVVNLLVNRN